MVDRLHRVQPTSTRAQRFDRLLLPVVTLLLLLGSAFVLSAWLVAQEAVRAAEAKDEARATHLAGSVDAVLQRRAADLQQWAERERALFAAGREAELARELRAQARDSTFTRWAAWLVVRADGSVAAVGEATPGRLVASDIAGELVAIGRTSAARNELRVSDRLRFGDSDVFALAVPIEPARRNGRRTSLLALTSLSRSVMGAFFGSEFTGEDQAADVVLTDSTGRVLLGERSRAREDVIRRAVGNTGWHVEFPRGDPQQLLPVWTLPLFAALLVACAGAFALQERTRRRLRVEAMRRAGSVLLLYELASRALHADTFEEQAQDLAASALDLAAVDGARVELQATPRRVVRETGRWESGQHQLRMPIPGQRGAVGELHVCQSGAPIHDSQRWALQTAATLVGAAVDTLSLLESERAVAAELQRLDELRSNLLATVAHELLSPLTAVKGVLGLLSMQDDLGLRGREFVEVATERTDRLVALIRDLFDCSLLETGQLDIKPRRQPADELLDAALGAQAAARPGELVLSATPNLLITCDPVRFDQLVNNLVTNAFRHGEAPVEVAVRPGDGGTFVVVSDEGPGIAPRDREEIFTKFWQGSTGHARAADGAGLGLSLVQGLVRVHGGDITIDSTHPDGRGARFTAFFPDAEVVELSGDTPGLGADEPSSVPGSADAAEARGV